MELMQRKITIIFLSTIIVRILFHFFTNFTFDDAFITFRYVENLALGNGFVYNKGEHVLGTTTPLFTLLLSFVHVLGFKIEQAAMMVSLLSSGITAVIVYKFACSLRMNHFAFVPVLLYILFPRLLVTDTAGMETSFFTLLITASFYYSHKQKDYYAWGMATLSAVTRPEGFLLLFLLGLKALKNNRDELLKLLSIPFTIIAPWFMFSYFYFGSVIPNSVSAKLALYSRFGSEPFLQKLSIILNFYNYYGIALVVLSFIGGYWIWKKQNYGILSSFWLLGMVFPLALSKTLLFIWYISPIYPIYLLFIGASFCFCLDRFHVIKEKIILIRKIVYIVVILCLVGMNVGKVAYFKSYQFALENIHKKVGLYLYTHAEKDAIVAAEDIGYMGYYSRLKIIDRDGLVSPEVIPYNRSGKYDELIVDYKPDWVVAAVGSPTSDFIDDNTFLQQYELTKSFSYESYQVYNLYKRK